MTKKEYETALANIEKLRQAGTFDDKQAQYERESIEQGYQKAKNKKASKNSVRSREDNAEGTEGFTGSPALKRKKRELEELQIELSELEQQKASDAELQKVEQEIESAKAEIEKMKAKEQPTPPAEPEADAPPLETSYLNPSEYKECFDKIKALKSFRRANKVADLKDRALKNAKTPKEKKEILAKNSVQDFTQGETKKTRVVKAFKGMLDYAEKQRVLTLQNNPNDTEKAILFKKNKEILEKAQQKVAIEAERALERFIVELHKRFEAGEDFSKTDFVVSISF